MRNRSVRTHRHVLAVALTCSAALLAGCTSGDSDTPAAAETDAVQTDAPVEESALVVTFAEYSAEAGGIEVSALAEGLVEEGGTCVAAATAEDGERLVGEPSEAEPGPATTECGALTIPLPAGNGGTWEVAVTYSSDSTELESPTVEVEIP